MKAMAVAVVALASVFGREPGETIRDRPVSTDEVSAAALPRLVDDDEANGGDLASVLAPEMGAEESTGEGADEPGDASSPRGQWQIACEIKNGSALVFDRASLRDYGAVTLFRWSAPRARVAIPGDQIFTALVDCGAKTIEAAWPGQRRETYAGTCGRGLVDAVCAASDQASAATRTGSPNRSHAPATRAVHRGATPRR
ncbi:MAG TPA: hypothetical protein VFH68_06820 [Polyangia bacterium]|jgi:hypothetical protein|nr:hypothetical protein [Polyangia bacterium]